MIDKRRITNVKVTYEVNTILSDLYNQIEYELRDDYNDSLEQLQSNWNSLREWLEKQISNDLDGIFSYSGRQCKETLDKMNELEKRYEKQEY